MGSAATTNRSGFDSSRRPARKAPRFDRVSNASDAGAVAAIDSRSNQLRLDVSRLVDGLMEPTIDKAHDILGMDNEVNGGLSFAVPVRFIGFFATQEVDMSKAILDR